MKNREHVFYKVLDPEQESYIWNFVGSIKMELFVLGEFDRKWCDVLYTKENNECFTNMVKSKNSLLELTIYLTDQLQSYIIRQTIHADPAESTLYTGDPEQDWFSHTIFICNHEYDTTLNQIFKKAVEWCEIRLNKKLSVQIDVSGEIQSNQEEPHSSGPGMQVKDSVVSPVMEFQQKIKDAIEDHLEEFIPQFQSKSEYEYSCSVLQAFFEGRSFSVKQRVFVRRGNKLLLAHALGSVYREFKMEGFTREFLQLLIDLYTVFKDEKIEGIPVTSSNLYKYCSR